MIFFGLAAWFGLMLFIVVPMCRLSSESDRAAEKMLRRWMWEQETPSFLRAAQGLHDEVQPSARIIRFPARLP